MGERKIETQKGLEVREREKIKRETCWEKEAEPQRMRTSRSRVGERERYKERQGG